MRPVALALLLLALAGQANAQGVPEPTEAPSLPSDAELAEFLVDPSTTAAEAYQVGVRLFEARRYEGAESAWLRAYALGRDPT
ncbi:MAG: hypothetical protein OES21_03225, partial [Myxococcales bacterium]|nr:hypothetical protein [Myxococcales bacterium]